MTWSPNTQSYRDQLVKERSKENLIAQAELAASWGVYDGESVGYSQSDLCSIIHKLVEYIKAN